MSMRINNETYAHMNFALVFCFYYNEVDEILQRPIG